MFTNHFLLNIFFFIITLTISLSEKLYKHYDYDQIIEAFTKLSKTCSHYIKIDTSQSRYNLDSIKSCGDKPCINLMVFLTDFDSYTLDRPSYYISSSIHGDEVIGGSSLVEFAKYFCDTYNNKKNSLYHNILKTKLIIMTPMTNAYGYYHKKRDEKVFIKSTQKYENVDPNRDFPYYNSRDEIKNCMRTLSARTINEIFNEFIISGAITFHGGDNVLGYPWGNYLHVKKNGYKKISTESPDFNAFDNIGKIMVKFSSSEKNEKNNIKQYGLGDMTSTVYPLDGALEDWAYGGWEFFQSKNSSDINPIKICKPDSFNKDYNMLWNYNDNNNDEYFYDYKLRCLIYLAEASNNKIPNEKEYGINDFDLEGNTRDVFDFYKTNNFYGHIPRNMRLVYSGVDLISASIYLDINNIKKIINEDNNMLQYNIPFIFMGCLNVKKYTIHKINFEHLTRDIFDKEYFDINLNSSTLISENNNNSDIKCYYNSNNTFYNISINLPYNNKTLRNLEKKFDPIHHFVRPGGDYDYLGNTLGVKINNLYTKKGSVYIIRGEAPDEDWGKQESPDPNVKPQSHVVRSKLYKNYLVKNGNHTLKSNYFFYSYPIIVFDNDEKNDIHIVNDVDSLFYEDEFHMMKLIINSNNKDINIDSILRFSKVNNNSNILTSENVFDVNLKIDIKLDKKKDLIKDIKNTNLISSILFLSDDTSNNLNCDYNNYYNNENMIFIKCNILKAVTGNYIRQKLMNAIIKFDLKQKNNTLLNVFGIFSIDNENKGQYLENNLMLCTNNFPFFIINENKNGISSDDIYYKIDIKKISTTKLRIKFEIKIFNNKYNNYYFALSFPFCEDLFFFKNNINEEKDIDINENSDGKIIGKTVHIIPIEKYVYDEIIKTGKTIKNNNNDVIGVAMQLNQISKNAFLYKSIPCSIISYNNIKSEKSKNKLINYFSEFKSNISNRNKIIDFYFIAGIIIGIISIIIIFYIIIKKVLKYNSISNQLHEEPVEISSSSNS